MDWRQFLATVVSALAWPTTVVLVAFVFRSSISDLLSRLAGFKAKDLEVVFRETLAGVPTTAAPAEGPKQEQGDLLKAPAYYYQLATISPRVALMEAWVEVEAAATVAFARHCSSGMRIFVSSNQAFEYLKANGLMPEDDYRLAKSLFGLRNKAAHQVDVSQLSTELIQTYINLAVDLARRLRRT
jgi:hypothetical protein